MHEASFKNFLDSQDNYALNTHLIQNATFFNLFEKILTSEDQNTTCEGETKN